MKKTWIGLASTLLLLGGGNAQAQANVSCTMDNSQVHLNFGSRIFLSGVSVPANLRTLSFRCVNSAAVPRRVYICTGFGDGSGGAASGARLMRFGTNTVAYQLHYDLAGSPPWDTMPNLGSYGWRTRVIPANTTSVIEQSVTGRILPGQTAVPLGIYTSHFPSNMTGIQVMYLDMASNQLLMTPCANPQLGSVIPGVTFQVSVTSQAGCRVGAVTPVDFGTPGDLLIPVQAVASVQLQCTQNLPYTIGINNGMYAQGNQRRMRRVSFPVNQWVRYELYRDAAWQTRWGTVPQERVSGTGDGQSQTWNIWARTPVQPTPMVGQYEDRAVITVYY